MAQARTSPESYPRQGPPDANRRATVRVVAMRGEHDPSTVVALSEMISSAIAIDDADLVVDASEVTFLDASAVGVLVRAHIFLDERSRSLLVRSPSACVRRILDICELFALIEGAEDRAVGRDPIPGLALELWVAIPATPRDYQPSRRSPDEPPRRDVATANVSVDQACQLALIGGPAARSDGRQVHPNRSQR